MNLAFLKGFHFESLAARAGVAVLVVLSAKVGFEFWASRAKSPYLTLGAELIAFAGLSMAMHHAGSDWPRAIGAIVLTLLAGGWCGLTTWEKLSADTLARFEATEGYKAAAADLAVAAPALRERLLAVAPADYGPRRLEQWNAAQAAAVASLTAAKASAEARMRPPFDLIAALRGAGVEVVKLFGFVCFGMSQRRKAPALKVVASNPGRDLANRRWARA